MRYHPWFQPLYRRVLTVVFCALWLTFELWVREGSFWIVMAVAVLAYSVWHFLLSNTYREPPSAPEEETMAEEPKEETGGE